MENTLLGWGANIPAAGITGSISLDFMVAAGLTVICFALGFMSGQQR